MTDKLNREMLKYKLEAVTFIMTGEQVEIRFKKPKVIGRSADVGREKHGDEIKIVFNINPDLSDESIYQGWLHESCHVHLGHHLSLPVMDEEALDEDIRQLVQAGIPFIEQSKDDIEAYTNNPDEIETYRLAAGLDDYARRNAEFKFQDDGILNRLNILARPLRKGDPHE